MCRSAANDAMDEDTQLVGVPAHIPMGHTGGQYFFVTVLLAVFLSQPSILCYCNVGLFDQAVQLKNLHDCAGL